MAIRLVIADDQRLLREALAVVLGALADLEVVALAADGEEAARRAAECLADVVLMDLRMPGVDGVQGTALVRTRRPEAAVLILTTFEDDQAARDALAAGALGYVLKACRRRPEVATASGPVRGAAPPPRHPGCWRPRAYLRSRGRHEGPQGERREPRASLLCRRRIAAQVWRRRDRVINR